MRQALQQAALAVEAGEVPIGAIVVRAQAVIGRAYNQVELLKDPTAHAEMIAITQAASAIGDWRLTDTVLYVTKEPCPMCAGAIALARIPKVVFGAYDPHPGFASLSKLCQGGSAEARNSGVIKAAEVQGGVLEEECRKLLQGFFKTLRAQANHPTS
jgi:tRNA(adenine34) deaminase